MCKPVENCIKEEEEEEFIQLFTEYSQHDENDLTSSVSWPESEFTHSAEMSQTITVKNEFGIQTGELNEQAVDLDNNLSTRRSVGQGGARNVSEENAVKDVSQLTHNNIKPGMHALVANQPAIVLPSSGQGTARTDDGEITSYGIPEVSDHYRKYSCTVCGAKFFRRRDLDRHVTIHLWEKPFSCSFCDKKFRLKELLALHEMRHKGKLPQCNLCGGRFVSLEKHIANIHSAANYEHFCSVCKKGFRTTSHMREHMLTHTDERKYTCQDCGHRFRTLKDLRTHMVIHTKEKNYVCNICGKKFAQSGNLSNHMSLHSAVKPYHCDSCNKAFKQPAALATHRTTHSSEKPFVCPTCGKRFRLNSFLKRHLLIHSGEQPYECSECGMKFNQSCSLQRHTLTHTGEKPYSCSDCGQRFTQSGGLCSHRRKHCSVRKTQA